MKTIYRVLGAFCILVAASVGFNQIIEFSGLDVPWRESGSIIPWQLINPPMALAVLIAIFYNLRRKLKMKDSLTVSREYLEVNLLFYTSIILTTTFFSNWLFTINAYSDAPEDIQLLYLSFWWFIDPAFILISGITGYHMIRDTNRTITSFTARRNMNRR